MSDSNGGARQLLRLDRVMRGMGQQKFNQRPQINHQNVAAALPSRRAQQREGNVAKITLITHEEVKISLVTP